MLRILQLLEVFFWVAQYPLLAFSPPPCHLFFLNNLYIGLWRVIAGDGCICFAQQTIRTFSSQLPSYAVFVLNKCFTRSGWFAFVWQRIQPYYRFSGGCSEGLTVSRAPATDPKSRFSLRSYWRPRAANDTGKKRNFWINVARCARAMALTYISIQMPQGSNHGERLRCWIPISSTSYLMGFLLGNAGHDSLDRFDAFTINALCNKKE